MSLALSLLVSMLISRLTRWLLFHRYSHETWRNMNCNRSTCWVWHIIAVSGKNCEILSVCTCTHHSVPINPYPLASQLYPPSQCFGHYSKSRVSPCSSASTLQWTSVPPTLHLIPHQTTCPFHAPFSPTPVSTTQRHLNSLLAPNPKASHLRFSYKFPPQFWSSLSQYIAILKRQSFALQMWAECWVSTRSSSPVLCDVFLELFCLSTGLCINYTTLLHCSYLSIMS